MESRSLLVSDLDGTLLGDEESLDRFAEWYEAHRASVRLVYATGRFFDSVVGLIGSTSLPEPDAVIGGVGTEIRNYPDGRNLVNTWPGCLPCWDRVAIQGVLAEYEELEPQPAELQARLKLSYYGYGLTLSFLAELRQRLATVGYRVDVIYSSNRDLDVLPAGVNKGSAAVFLASEWQLCSAQVVVSGDTGNDLSMFLRGFRGIVPANAHAELKVLRSPDIYHSKLPYAAGVLDGIEYWLKKVMQPRAFSA